MHPEGMDACTLVLIRHAEMQDASGDPEGLLCGWCEAPLSERGRLQARLLARRFVKEPPAEALYSSPLRRAIETAQALSEALRLPLRIENDLREIYCGVLDGHPLSEARSNYPGLWARNLAQTDEDFRWPGGETYRAFRARCLGALRRIAARHPGRRVLAVTHAGVVSQCVGWLNGVSAARWDLYRPGNATITEVRWAEAVLRFDDAAA
jgi:broad specificity phosphatase PhoE